MVTNEHPAFDHRLEGLLIHVDGERDGILLCVSRHRYSEIIRIEVVHVCNRRLCLVEGAPTVDDFQSTLWIRGHHARRGMDPLLWWNIRAQQQLVGLPFLLGSLSTGLIGRLRAAVTPYRAFSPISSTFGGSPIGIPCFIDAPASLGTPFNVV